MGYLFEYKYDGAYRIWTPSIGVKESRDVVFYERMAHGAAIEARRREIRPQPAFAPPPIPLPTPTLTSEAIQEINELASLPNNETSRERVTIRIPVSPSRAAESGTHRSEKRKVRG